MEKEYCELDEIAVKAGTDKSSLGHNYMHAYARCFAPFRKKPIRFLEIGLHEGNSVQLWEEYFPKAELHFIDIDLSLVKYHSKRAHYHQCDQENPIDLAFFLQKMPGPFDIIVDDGGHSSQQQVTSFLTLFRSLKSGGLYVIEDLHGCYKFAVKGKRTTMDLLKKMIDELNFIGTKTSCGDQDKVPPELLHEMTFFRKEIRSLSFWSNLVMIERR